MSFIPTILFRPPYIVNLNILGWIGWFILLVLEIGLLYQLRKSNSPLKKSHLGLLSFIIFLLPITSLFLGIEINLGKSPAYPNLPANSMGSVAMILSAIPWILAGGIFGPLPAAIFGGFSGLLQGIWITHNPYTILEFSMLAVLFSYLIGQRFRTPAFTFMRRPLVSVGLLLFLFPILYLYQALFTLPGGLFARIEYSFTSFPQAFLALGIVLFTGGLCGEVVAISFPKTWKTYGSFIPSPAERSLEKRFILYLAPFSLLIAGLLMVFTWTIANKTARNLVEETIKNNVELAAKNVPIFFQAGQQQIQAIAQDERLTNLSELEKTDLLQTLSVNSAFFQQLSLLDDQGENITGYPQANYDDLSPSLREVQGVQLALKGVPYQAYSAIPEEGTNSAKVAFIAPILGKTNNILGVIVGRTDINTNPYTEIILQSLVDSAGQNGSSVLVDENGDYLVHPNPNLVMTRFESPIDPGKNFLTTIGPDGTHRLTYLQPIEGYGWSIVTSIPAKRTSNLALQLAAPLYIAILIVTFVALATLQIGLHFVAKSITSLTAQADQIAKGKLDNPLELSGEDELGELRKAFEKMRHNLKSRLDELNRLLVVSQGVASSLDVEEALQPVLTAALSTGAFSARVVLAPSIIPELEAASNRPISFAQGPGKDQFAYLDEQILAINQQQFQLILSNASQQKKLHYQPDQKKPESLIAFALRHENIYFGSLWLAFDQVHRFTSEEVRFIATLASQAVLAAVNARLFMNAEIGRQRFSAILASSPDPILVTDQRSHLLVANPAAIHLFKIDISKHYQTPIQQIIENKELVKLLQGQRKSKDTIELTLPGGQVFMTTASSILAQGDLKGRVCILRDVTRFKQLDDMKSEFVATVSHDLRSPLTLMRGYATMLEMVGSLNEQQSGYVKKIISGVENMSHLVNNLLDLGRIETGIGLQLDNISVQNMVGKILEIQKIHAAQKQIQLTAEISPNVPEFIEADLSLLQQALTNLVENALKFTRPNGMVHILIERDNEQILFEVIDNGIGISPLDQPRLFEKFYQGAHGNPKDARGTGLGLSIVKSITERHGGHVGVESQLGKGSKFTISLPIQIVIIPEH